jgi:hypothetical protein
VSTTGSRSRPTRSGGRSAGRASALNPWLGLVALFVLVAAGGLVLLQIGGDDTPESSGPGGAAEPGVAHVHGLGVNPADGSLIVATHYGSFRIPAGSGDAERIGDSYQDTMGFTVAGQDRFLGSGHPDVAGMRQGQPGQLGLIESTDAGSTWTTLSLGGEVDFHGLAFAHDQVYGWDSGTGRFMVSDDEEEWETRSTIDLVTFAVDPDDAEHIVGAAPDGLIESTDGGRTWDQVDGPQLLVISWDRAAGLSGADPGGVVWRFDGSGWGRTGTLPGQPQAFLATADALYAAAADETEVTGIYESTDGGGTWDLRYRDSPP